MKKTREKREREIVEAEAALSELRPLHNNLVRQVRAVKGKIRYQQLKLGRARNALSTKGRA